MLRLRPYKPCDAQRIVSWCRDETTFELWGGTRFGSYPVSAEVMNRKYFDDNGDCAEADNFYPMTAFDADGAAGHFIMRYLNGNNKILRFGWVIVDDSKRGRHYGQKMLRLGLRFAFELLQADKVTIGVVENNAPALHCYLSVGFHEAEHAEAVYETVQGVRQKIIELEITKEEYQ